MAFGYEIDFSDIDAKGFKAFTDVLFIVILLVLLGLFVRLVSGRTPTWYTYLEKALAWGFVFFSVSLLIFLPLTWQAAKIYLSYYFFQIFLFYVLPGKSYRGLPVAEQGNKKRSYKCNGLLAYIITIFVFFYGGVSHWWSLSIIYNNFAAILNVVNAWAILVSIMLYIKGKVAPTIKQNPTGSFAHDFWEGLELNPEIFGFDIKFWSESRPGLIGWVLVDLSLAAHQHYIYGGFSTPMVLVTVCHFLYVLDYFVHESYIVSTWDIAQENFGFMLAWGDYAWLPFFYSIPQWLLLDNAEVSDMYASGCFMLFLFGYFIFRLSNRQKHLFKTWIKEGQKEGQQMGGGFVFNDFPRVIRSKSNGPLLISGWWGLARHINYTGDLLMALSFGLGCGTRYGWFAYSHFIFLLGLLLHRFARDDQSCLAKYGRDWVEYCRLVPHRFIPHVF